MIALGIDTGEHCWASFLDVPQRSMFRPRFILTIELDADNRCGHLMELIRANCPECAGIEYVDTVIPKLGFGPKMARDLLRAARVVGNLENECKHQGLTPTLVTAPVCRKVVVGNARPSDAEIKQWCRLAIDGLPTSTNNHARDAMVAGIYAARHAAIGGS